MAANLSGILTASSIEPVNSLKFNALRIWHEGCAQDNDAFLETETMAELLL
jgi:hypothetical protein